MNKVRSNKEKISYHISKHPSSLYSRRDFIKLVSAAGMGTLLSACMFTDDDSDQDDTFPEIPRPSEYRDAIIIGSGFGGSVTALRLTEAGIETTIIEKGKRWEITPDGTTFSPYLNPDGRSTWLNELTVIPIGPALPIDKYVGVLEGHFYTGLRVLTGAAYGGGSIVYGGLLVKPRRDLFNRVFASKIHYDELEPYYQRAGNILEISTIPDDIYETEYFAHYRVVEEQNTVAGLSTVKIYSASDWEIVRDEISGKIPPSIIHGEAIYGVNSGAKKTLDMNYLSMAEQSGRLEVKTLHQVKNIGIDGNNNYLVQTEEIDTQGIVINEVVFSCKYLFLAAGSIGTSNLLVKAKEKGFLPYLNDHVGKGWSNNGNVEVLRWDVGEPTGKWQGGPPAVAVQDYDNPKTPMFIEHPQFPIGSDCSCLLYFGIGINPTKGYFYYDPGTDKVELSWPDSDNQQETINNEIINTMEKLNDANQGVISTLLFPDGYNDKAVFHPLGGAVLGEACDNFGRIRNYSNLYVMDSSLIPGSSAAANPSFTVAAIAERNIEKIIKEDF